MENFHKGKFDYGRELKPLWQTVIFITVFKNLLLQIPTIIEIFHILSRYFQSRWLQICCLWENIKGKYQI